MKNIIHVIRAVLRTIINLFRKNRQQESEQEILFI